MLRISFTNKNIRKKLILLVDFLINQKIGGQLGLLPHSFFSQNHSIKTMKKSFSQKNKYANFVLFINLRRVKERSKERGVDEGAAISYTK